MRSPGRQRVVVADDSRLMRRMVSDALDRRGFDVVATAGDGDAALAACAEHRPDALTLDLAMPGMDGIGVLRALRDGRADPVPVVVVSAFSPAHGARAVDALAEGAFDLVAKPAAGEELGTFADELGHKVGQAAAAGPRRVRLRRRGSERDNGGRSPSAPSGRRPDGDAGNLSGHPRGLAPSRARGTGRVVVIACSTGGPRALGELVPRLPSPLGAGTLIVQHMPAGFTASLAARLDGASVLAVREAAPGDPLAPDTALLAPGGAHLRVGDDGRVRLSGEAPVGALRPRADLTIADAARAWGRRVVLAVLTGMGRDGLDGAHAVRRAGGRVLCEAESSCTVYGMPRAVADAGLADAVLDLDDLAGAIAREAAR